MNVLWETMIDEMRAVRFELDARRHFTAERQPIELTRDLVGEWTNPVREDPHIVATHTAMAFNRAASQGLIEVG